MLSTDTSWKFLTDACVTRPPKLRQYAPSPGFHRGGLLRSTMDEASTYDLYLPGGSRVGWVGARRLMPGGRRPGQARAAGADTQQHGGLAQPSAAPPARLPAGSMHRSLGQQAVVLAGGAQRQRPLPARLQLGQYDLGGAGEGRGRGVMPLFPSATTCDLRRRIQRCPTTCLPLFPHPAPCPPAPSSCAAPCCPAHWSGTAPRPARTARPRRLQAQGRHDMASARQPPQPQHACASWPSARHAPRLSLSPPSCSTNSVPRKLECRRPA